MTEHQRIDGSSKSLEKDIVLLFSPAYQIVTTAAKRMPVPPSDADKPDCDEP
ncbi:hypothetical protein [Bartonella apis]|uniref:hypothetical protein n=1 Tax=Bartonella apis TaxID=1686310 RepID=UPI00242DC80E|nr:hypothetical protein [Bartonella apis]